MKSLCRQSDSVQYVLCILKWMIKLEATLLGEIHFKYIITQAYYILVMFQSWAENIIRAYHNGSGQLHFLDIAIHPVALHNKTIIHICSYLLMLLRCAFFT